MTGMSFIIVGAVILTFSVMLAAYSILYTMTKAKRIKSELKEEYF